MRIVVLCFIWIAAGCSAKKTEDKNLGESTDAERDTTVVNGSDPEPLFDIGNLYSVTVDDTHIYISHSQSIARAPKVEDNRELQTLGGYAGFPNQNLYMDDQFIYVLYGSGIMKFNKTTEERDFFSLEEFIEDVYDVLVITGDENRLYTAGIGCKKIVSLTKQGNDPWVAELERTGAASGNIWITVDSNHIYCSGGGEGSTMGRIYSYPKEQGEFKEVTTTPNIEDSLERAYGPQVGPMVIVENTIYYIQNYGSGSYRVQKLVSAPHSGGPSTIIEEFLFSNLSFSLRYNNQRNALYMDPRGIHEHSIIQYNLSDNSLSRVLLPDSTSGALGLDEKYLYFGMADKLHRIEIF